MRRVVLLLVGVAAVAALPVQDVQPSTQAEVIHKLLLANPDDNSIVPKLKDDQLPSSSSSVPPLSPSPPPSPSPIPTIQMSTPTEERDKKVEDNQEQVQEQEEQRSSEQSKPQVNEKPIIVIKPLPVESDVEEMPLIPQLVPIRVESEVEQIPPNDDLGYMSAEEDFVPMPEEPLVEYLPLDAEVEEEVVDEYDEDEFPVEPFIVDFPLEAEADEFPVETEDVDLPFAPDFELPTEPEEEDLSFESDIEPLPPQVYEDGSDLGVTEEEEGIIYVYPPMEDPDSDVFVDADVEEPYESFESQEDDTISDENIPPGFFSWVLPGYFGDEELSEDVPPGAETPIVEDPIEYEVEEELSSEVSGEMLEEDTYPDTVDALVVDSDESFLSQEEDTMLDEVIPSELEPFMIDEEVGPEEEVMDELPLDEETPYEEGEDVYFPPIEDYIYDKPEEDVYTLDGEMLMAEDEISQEEEGFPMYEDFGLEENLSEHDYYNPSEMRIFDDEMPEGPHDPYVFVDEPDALSEFHPIIFPTPNLKAEWDESPEDEPVLLENEPVADDTPVIIDQPPRTLQIFSSSPAPGRIPLRDILFPFLNMNDKDREDGMIMMEREEASDSPQYDMHIMVLGAPQDLDDAQIPVMPIAGESMIPQGRPFPIAEFPDQDFHHMDHPPNWTPNDDDDDDDNNNNNNNNNKPSYSPLNINPNNFPMLFDQFSDNLPHSSFYEPEVWPQHWTQSRNRFVSNTGGHFPAHGNMQHHHQPPRFMDSATPLMADASHLNDFGVNFNDDYESYEPPMEFKKTCDATMFKPNLNGFNSFKPTYSEVFGFPHSHDHRPINPPRSFSSSQHYHGPGPFRQHYHNPDSHPQKPFMYPPSTPFRTSQSDYNVFQYRPEQDIYLSGPQSPLDPYMSFYQDRSHHNTRPTPFTSFSRSQSQLGNTHPLEITLYPERESYHDSPFNSRPQFPFLPFPVEQQSFNGETSPAYYDRSHHSPPQQSYHASPLYSSNHPNARYAPAYP